MAIIDKQPIGKQIRKAIFNVSCQQKIIIWISKGFLNIVLIHSKKSQKTLLISN